MDGPLGPDPTRRRRVWGVDAGAGGGLLDPVVVASLAVLLVNDHMLKALARGTPWSLLTGKLSDVAGLVFLPVLVLAALELLAAWRGRFHRPEADEYTKYSHPEGVRIHRPEADERTKYSHPEGVRIHRPEADECTKYSHPEGVRIAGPSPRQAVVVAVIIALVFSAMKTSETAGAAYAWTLAALQWPVRAVLATLADAPLPALRPVVHVVDPSDVVGVVGAAFVVWQTRRRAVAVKRE